jgi:hypothetical protein
MAWWQATSHLRNAKGFNRDWAEWIAKYGETATPAQVLQAAAKIAATYGIPFWW